MLKSLFQPDVDSILEEFHKVIKRLDTAVEFYNSEAARQLDLMAQAQNAKQFAEDEGKRALRIAGQLSELLR